MRRTAGSVIALLACVALVAGCEKKQGTGSSAGVTSREGPWSHVRFIILSNNPSLERPATPGSSHIVRQEQVVWINLTGASQRVSFKKGYPFEGSDSVFAVAPYKPSRKYTIRSDAKKNYEYEYSVMPLQNMSGPQAPEVIIDD